MTKNQNKTAQNRNLWAISISSYHLTNIGIPMLKIRRSHNRLIFNMGIPIPRKYGLYIETGPWSCPVGCCGQPYYLDCKVHGATSGRQNPGGSHNVHTNLAIWVCSSTTTTPTTTNSLTFCCCFSNSKVISASWCLISLTMCLFKKIVQANNKENTTLLALCEGIQQWPVDFPTKGPVMWKMFPCHEVNMCCIIASYTICREIDSFVLLCFYCVLLFCYYIVSIFLHSSWSV